MKIHNRLKRSGKNLKIVYYIKCFARYLMPPALLRCRLKRTLATIAERNDRNYIEDRVNYYNKLNSKELLPQSAKTLGEHKLKGHKSVYFFDTYEYTRWFAPQLRWSYLFGDINYIPETPSIVKSRPVGDNNQNGVILNLVKVRHFCFLEDKTPFTSKMNKVIFRGEAYAKPRRQLFIDMYANHPLCDIGDTSNNPLNPKAEKITLYEHLNYKFIMALEGNDVASNLKWVMSSNSIAIMPRPTCETWFMEGRLIPNYHYIEIKSDYSDLIERINYYAEHTDEAQEIINHAHEYIRQFQNAQRESLISLLVLKKYLDLTN